MSIRWTQLELPITSAPELVGRNNLVDLHPRRTASDLAALDRLRERTDDFGALARDVAHIGSRALDASDDVDRLYTLIQLLAAAVGVDLIEGWKHHEAAALRSDGYSQLEVFASTGVLR
ncbi:MAG: hypothetical protein R2715_15055 [Ilumatobacteraceae bacterium]